MKKLFLFFITFMLLAANVNKKLSAQEDPVVVETHAEDMVETADPLYYIRSIDFEVKGTTHDFALMRQGKFKYGEQIQGNEELKKYIEEKTQLLMNERVLETVEITYTVGEPEENDGTAVIPVDLLVNVKDTWNVIVLPKPTYKDGEGYSLILKGRDYNFLGTMNALRIDLGYELDVNKTNANGEKKGWDFYKGDVLFEIDADIPFSALGHIWSVNFDHAFAYTYGEPLYYKNTTGLSLELPYKRTTFTVGFDEYVIVNERKSDDEKGEYGGGERFGGAYMGTEIYGLWGIPTGLSVGKFGELTYTPRVSSHVNYKPGGNSDYPWKGPHAEFSHTLGFGRVDWIGNYRKGLEVEARNAFGYNIYKQEWNPNLSFTAKGYLLLSDFFGLSGRMTLQTWFYNTNTNVGGDLRGILDRYLQAETMLSLNMDFPFRILRFYPSEIFDNPKLHLLDFEIHASPFIDLAMIQGLAGDPDGTPEKIDFSPENIFCTGGLELFVFPAFARSIYLRVSLGSDLREWAKTGKSPLDGNSELEIVLGHLY
ncbi:hypothetical protein AGMMS49928_15260 [Spirochaetia bacterium]|nr:hypothetical protein AGMMS49928_15260 [Spirochaetia bacterium]